MYKREAESGVSRDLPKAAIRGGSGGRKWHKVVTRGTPPADGVALLPPEWRIGGPASEKRHRARTSEHRPAGGPQARAHAASTAPAGDSDSSLVRQSGEH
ncbi:hypothetical protein PCANC_13740 [Puccinia coronata f. sp. avenae]|uniref:Uncharacterized protein n=1 Tax=Puccinia coronata f. sp. avenae TaxID=200324 RepID=A0A2N5VFM9_9BASI|nr:hypothetical protein PCANC_13740 [Puccinia coronata f. sp. avenae]